MKKNTMDVARLMIITSCQKVVDEFIDVLINGEVFHLRVLEDSYGPMRILIPQHQGSEGRDPDDDSEHDEDEEEVRGPSMEAVLVERETEGVEQNYLASAPIVNANNGPTLINVSNMASSDGREVVMETPHNSNSNSHLVNTLGSGKKGEQSKGDSKMVAVEVLLDQGDGEGGSQNSNNTHFSIAGGGVGRNMTQSEDPGCLHKSH
jgi:hypothetical protein